MAFLFTVHGVHYISLCVVGRFCFIMRGVFFIVRGGVYFKLLCMEFFYFKKVKKTIIFSCHFAQINIYYS